VLFFDVVFEKYSNVSYVVKVTCKNMICTMYIVFDVHTYAKISHYYFCSSCKLATLLQPSFCSFTLIYNRIHYFFIFLHLLYTS